MSLSCRLSGLEKQIHHDYVKRTKKRGKQCNEQHVYSRNAATLMASQLAGCVTGIPLYRNLSLYPEVYRGVPAEEYWK